MEERDSPNTAELLAAVKKGDQGACSALIDQLYPAVIAIVRGHLPRNEHEEDLTQDIFLKVFSKLDQYNNSRPLSHWVSRIAMNTCYDALRKQKRRKVVTFSDLSLEDTDFLEFALEEEQSAPPASRELTSELLDKLFEGLKPQQQMVIRMLDLEEKTVAEVSELTGWGASKIRVTAMRARRKLEEILSRLEDQGIDETTKS